MREAFEKVSIFKLFLVAIMSVIVLDIIDNILGLNGMIATQIVNIILVMYIFYRIKENGQKLEFDFSIFKKQGIKLEMVKLEIIKLFLASGIATIVLVLIYIIDPNKMNEVLSEEAITGSFMFQFIVGVIIAPIVEEFIFRGVIFTRLSTKVSVAKAMIISSALFGLLHITLNIGGAFASGIVMCMLFRKYDNILVNIVLHMLHNFIATMRGVFPATTKEHKIYTYNDLSSMMVMGFMVFIPSIYFLIKYIKNNKEIFKKNESCELKEVS